MVVRHSERGHAETVAALIGAIEGRGLTVFARFDHAAGARAVGLELAEEEVVVFGSPRAGTPLMQSDARVGIELPLRVLVWDGAKGVHVGYTDPRELADRYELAGHATTLEQMAKLLEELTGEASQPAQG